MLAEKNSCTGCGGCSNICPQKAITMEPDAEGFLYPGINKLCNDCGLCERVCPALNAPALNDAPSEAFAVWTNDEADRMASSSGGFFNILVQYTLDCGGVVYGAAFDENNRVYHTHGENAAECKKFAGSKYVQSDIGDSFQNAGKDLASGRHVLFSGTPCQIAGLYAFLGKKYDKLLTCDLVCNGVPSPLVFERYLKFLEQKHDSKATAIKFKDKRNGWKNPHFTVEFESGAEYSKNINLTEYGRGFGQALFLRPSCGFCAYAKLNRPADFTLADFWGIGESSPFEHNTGKGVSLVLINSEKAKAVFPELPQAFTCVKREISEAVNGNSRLKYPLTHSPKRGGFFNAMSALPFETVMAEHLAVPGFAYRMAAKVLSDDMKKAIRKLIRR